MADPSYNYSYTPIVEHREENLYREEYYSSTDTDIYFDDELQTEIGFIQYEISEQLKPVYGYNSRTFDDVVIGNRIVTGTFTVPIKNKAPQDIETSVELESGYINVDNSTSQYNYEENNNLLNTDWFGSTKKNIDKHNNHNIDSEFLTKLIALGYNVTANSSTGRYQNVIKQFQKEHNLGVTGVLNQVTKSNISQEFDKLSAQTVTLNGATGYNDISMTSGKTQLSGNGIIMDSVDTSDGTIYKVLDSNGKFYYMKGLII